MSGIFNSRIFVTNEMIQEYPSDVVNQQITNKLVQDFSHILVDLMQITQFKKPEVNGIEFHTQIAILPADEYKRLKKIEEEYQSYLERYRG